MGSGFAKIKKQQKALAKQMAEMEKCAYNGSAGNGLVNLSINAHGKLLSITIKPECVDPNDVEGLQDLILAAWQDAEAKASNATPAPAIFP